MTTKFYFHEAASTVVGTLPAAEQSALTITESAEVQTTNRSMDQTIGVAQTSKAIVINQSTQRTTYFTRFCSQPINQTSIAANTWNYAFAGQQSSTGMQFPIANSSADTVTVRVTCYVWRPGGGGSNVGNILDGASNTTYGMSATTAEKSLFGTFAGSAVTIQVGDIICIEIIFVYTPTTGSKTGTFYYDGTTETNNDGTTVSNHASYIETPENIAFVVAGTTSRPRTQAINLSRYRCMDPGIELSLGVSNQGGVMI